MRLGFEHSYFALPSRFYAPVKPTAGPNPQLVVFNEPLARELGMDPAAACFFSGNELPEDATPIALAYAGHQFGGFVPRLGDGRAILLGELKGFDVQLKGSGVTPFSRSGDGRATIGPMLREYLLSEAMHALGIPTTRSLAVFTTGETVYRELPLPGAILTRVAASHIRVGTFQYFAARGDTDGLQELLNYVVKRHYPAASTAPSPALAVLKEVAQRQVELITQWMLVGFIHGVMNTDNMAISGETIDYGPCAFMDEYDPKTVFSSIDRGGRYSYGNQPVIAQWNLLRFAETLLKLIDPDTDKAVALATAALDPFMDQFDELFLAGMRRKIGLSAAEDGDAELVRDLLGWMQEERADFTQTFRKLSGDKVNELRSTEGSAINTWLAAWTARLARDHQSPEQRAANMRKVNPAFIPRNHRVDVALKAAEKSDYAPFFKLLGILQKPFDDQPEAREYELPPAPEERVLQTFCGT
jgi:serine/tyrosine/threonine adenylyltransferase